LRTGGFSFVLDFSLKSRPGASIYFRPSENGRFESSDGRKTFLCCDGKQLTLAGIVTHFAAEDMPQAHCRQRAGTCQDDAFWHLSSHGILRSK
jgi:hypothetical protein